ncbi:dihydroorotase [Psychroflexus aestuariivivens]|uniref:dihydroorotase n=1 Tax=Psychroflexus aestuariivivens TaxID=1795040 RepID=UPI000FD7A74C|nr:dihydroorotase [Psychroflexus aestuariivivens]
MSILLKSATILDSDSQYHKQTKDILIKDGFIENIADEINGGDQIIDKKNLYISCGFFDSSVSFGEPGFEERETLENGVATARKSGFTSIFLNPNLNPITDRNSGVKFLKQQTNSKEIDLHPIGAMTKGFDGKNLAELFDMANGGAIAFYDFKKPIQNGNLLKIALQYVQSFGGLIFSFPLDQNIAGQAQVNEDEFTTYIGLKGMPALAEEIQIARDLNILTYTGGKLHIPNISTQKSVELIKKAKNDGLNVTCSVAIHHLFFNSNVLGEFDSRYKVLPPLRTEADQLALVEAVQNGIIDMVTADHEPMNEEFKTLEFENASFGSIGLESAFGVLNTIFDKELTAELLSKTKSKFGLKNSKIEIGAEADLSLFNPELTYNFKDSHIFSKSKNSMFLGEELKGKVYGSIYKDSFYEN